MAYPLLPAGPDSGGGAEQILYLLQRGLVRRGYRSVVIAAKGSQVSGELIETCTFDGEITEEIRAAAQRAHFRAIESALERFPIDLIHFHGLDFYRYLPANRVPTLATLHLPPAWYPECVFELADVELTCVSRTQASETPGKKRPHIILNGIDTAEYGASRGERRHLLWLGRICPEKGVHIGLEVAHGLDLPMVVAGPVHPFRDHETYFRERVQPLFDAKRRYVGPVGREQKKALLRETKCLLIPSLVAETSSLTAMEAISSGRPVIAFRSGALPEVVEDGVTGFVVDSQHEMAEAVKRTSEISDATCRERARARFDAERMIDDYVRLYESL